MPASYRFIDTAEELGHFCETAARFPWLAVDTEFIREKTYYPRWCLLQLATPEEIACIDVLAIEDMAPAMALMDNPAVLKLFHAARQDMEIFHLAAGRPPAPVFDTQLAAALAGHGDQIGYGNLVQSVLNVELDKGHARCDWSRRPLSDAELAYAADDVRHLGALYKTLSDELESRGRLAWLQTDFDELSDPAQYTPDPAQAWRRLKGLGRLKPRQQHLAARLAEWREQLAMERDLPRKWILGDNALTDLAQRPPRSLDDLRRFRDIGNDSINRYGETLIKLLDDQQDLPAEPLVEGKRLIDQSQEPVVDLLMACLRDTAIRNDLSPAMLGKRADLERLVAGERDLPLLRGWRRTAAGEALLEVLEGKASLKVSNGHLARE